MTEITDLSTTDSSNTAVTGGSIDGAIANMGRMDNTLQAILGLLARSIRTNVLRFLDNADPTKKVALDLTGLPTATERTWTAPYYSGTLGLVSDIRGQIYGLTLSNNVTDPTNDIDIAAGSVVDTTGAASMLLASSLTKRLDAAWAVGTNQGGLDTGSIANNTYHVYIIRRPDTGVVDVCFSASATDPTTGGSIPAAYTQYRRIGSILRESGTIIPFWQNGNLFYRVNASLDVSVTDPGILEAQRTLAVPNLIEVDAIINVCLIIGSGAGAGSFCYVSSYRQANQAPSGTAAPLSNLSVAKQVSNNVGSVQLQIRTLADRTIRSRLSYSDGNIDFRIATLGWVDQRGQY